MSGENEKRLVILGAGEFAEIAHEYFTTDSCYEVVGFAVEPDYLTGDSFRGLPLLSLDAIGDRFPPDRHEVFVAVTYTQLNRVRTRLYDTAKAMGYRAATYVSSRAFVWKDVRIGENCFIFENNVLQYKAEIADNVIMWSGNHIGHRAVVGDNTFISSHVVVSGYCLVGDSCFLGVNSAINDRIAVADDCIIASGSVVTKATEPGKLYHGNPAVAARASSYVTFQVRPEDRR